MTELMVKDVTNPPLAARFFSYPCMAGYEVVSENNTKFKSMYEVLNDYPARKRSDSISNYSYQLAALLAMLETAKKLQPSGILLEKYETHFLDSLNNAGYNAEVIEQSKKYAVAVSRKILQYAKADNYNEISNYQRYTPLDKEGTWYPTPPAYIAAIEPYFGHLLVGIKKISPGAHWLGITGIACEKAEKSFDETLQVYTAITVGLMDTFICCWDEKYRSNRIRNL